MGELKHASPSMQGALPPILHPSSLEPLNSPRECLVTIDGEVACCERQGTEVVGGKGVDMDGASSSDVTSTEDGEEEDDVSACCGGHVVANQWSTTTPCMWLPLPPCLRCSLTALSLSLCCQTREEECLSLLHSLLR